MRNAEIWIARFGTKMEALKSKAHLRAGRRVGQPVPGERRFWRVARASPPNYFPAQKSLSGKTGPG
jgi:hypothetical protein